MDWRTTYKDKIMTADEAVRHIKSGDHITVAERLKKISAIL